MSPLELFKDWLGGVPTARDFTLCVGHWLDFETSTTKRYIAYQIVGGASPREVNTRQIQVALTLVGAREDSLDAITTLAENIYTAVGVVPPQCDIVAVNMVGEFIGPLQSANKRPLLTVTLLMIL